MPRKKKPERMFYEHPELGPLPLEIHPTKPWRVVAYHQGREIYEADLASHSPELEPEPAPEPEPEEEGVTDVIEEGPSGSTD